MLPDNIEFTKLNAGGNDFICIDNTTGVYQELLKSQAWPVLVRMLCRRALSVGADGLIVACERGSGAGVDIVARFLEPDGTEAKLCGNGTACFSYWALANHLVAGPEVDILTAAGAAHAIPDAADPRRVTVCVPKPHGLRTDIEIAAAGQYWQVSVIDTGVPHAVVFVDSLEDVDVRRCGAAIRNHERFQDLGGVNANFVSILREGHIAIRTFEFGVEDETLACGTGSAAAAIVTAVRHGWDDRYLKGKEPVCVDVRGGVTLRIWFEIQDDGTFSDTCLETTVRAVYTGQLCADFIAELQAMVMAKPSP